MTGSEQKEPKRPKADERPKLGRVAVRRIGDGLRDLYDTPPGNVPSKLRELLDKLERTTADESAVA